MEHCRLETVVVSLPEVEPRKRPIVLDGVVLPEIDQRESSVFRIGDMSDNAREDVCEERAGV